MNQALPRIGNRRLLEALAVFLGGLFRIPLSVAVHGQVSQLMGNPVTQPVFALVAVVIDKNGPAGQMGEHQAAISFRDMELKGSRCIEILPMGYKEDSEGQ